MLLFCHLCVFRFLYLWMIISFCKEDKFLHKTEGTLIKVLKQTKGRCRQNRHQARQDGDDLCTPSTDMDIVLLLGHEIWSRNISNTLETTQTRSPYAIYLLMKKFGRYLAWRGDMASLVMPRHTQSKNYLFVQYQFFQFFFLIVMLIIHCLVILDQYWIILKPI